MTDVKTKITSVVHLEFNGEVQNLKQLAANMLSALEYWRDGMGLAPDSDDAYITAIKVQIGHDSTSWRFSGTVQPDKESPRAIFIRAPGFGIRTNELCRLIRGNVAVRWIYIGEGKNGDFDPDDQGDIPLLRFDVLKIDPEAGDEDIVDHGSYCTNFPLSASSDDLERALDFLMDRFYKPVSEGESIRRLGAEMSWISPEWVKEKQGA